VLDVLTEPSYRRNAEHVRDEIATLPDISGCLAGGSDGAGLVFLSGAATHLQSAIP
jgi:hypothetical protein